jgi:SprT protein
MSNLVSPQLVPLELQELAEENVKKALTLGTSKLNVHISFEGVRFFNKSRTAGYIVSFHGGMVYLNIDLFKRNREHFIKDTIPHEVAHLIADKINLDNHSMMEGAHGKTWKMVMRKVYGLEPTRCHSLDTTGIGKKVSKYRYICKCMKHTLGQPSHNKVQKGQKAFRCAKCYDTLTFLSKID